MTKQGKQQKNRISKKGREAIASAARRRWRAYRKAKKAGNMRLAKKISGFRRVGMGALLLSLMFAAGSERADELLLEDRPKYYPVTSDDRVLIAVTEAPSGSQPGVTCCCQTFSGGMCCAETGYCGSVVPGCVCRIGAR